MAILVLCAASGHAEEDDDSGFSLSVLDVRILSLDRSSLEFTPGAREMVEGFTHQQVLQARVSANANWVLTISGTEGNWSGPWPKPVEYIYWKYDGGEYVCLTTSAAEVFSGGPADQRTLPVHFKVKLDFETDLPGRYTYEYVVFELAEP